MDGKLFLSRGRRSLPADKRATVQRKCDPEDSSLTSSRRHYLNGSLVFMDDLGRDREADASTSSTLGGSEEFKEMILEITWDSSSIIFDLHATGSDRIRPGSDADCFVRRCDMI